MAKKKETKIEVEEPQIQENVVEAPQVVEQPKARKRETPSNEWEIKDRMYYLTNNRSPLTYLIRGSNIFWFDEEKGYERELKYTSNQRTCFVDEMKGDQRLEHIIF